MKRILFVIMIIAVGMTTACSSALSQDDKSSDNTHAFQAQSTQIIDEIGTDIAPEGESYLVIKYQIENLQDQDDSPRRWNDYITIGAGEDRYEATSISSLDNQLWETSLSGNEKKAGYMVFTVPEDVFHFKLTFTFPTSETEVVYDLTAIDKRISANVDWILTRFGEIENNKKIPLVGEPLATSNPIRYRGIILVPKEEIPALIEQTEGLTEDAKRKVIEDYLIAHGYCHLE